MKKTWLTRTSLELSLKNQFYRVLDNANNLSPFQLIELEKVLKQLAKGTEE